MPTVASKKKLFIGIAFSALALTCCVNANRDLALFKAIEGHDLTAISQAILDGASVHARNSKGHSAMLFTRLNGCHDCFTHLLERGADPDLPGFKDQPLINAFLGPDGIDYLKSAVEFGANVNIKVKTVTGQEESFIIQAIKSGQREVIHYLLHIGAKTDVVDSKGQSLLEVALSNLKLEVACLLLDNNIIAKTDTVEKSEQRREQLSKIKSQYKTASADHWVAKTAGKLIEKGLLSDAQAGGLIVVKVDK